MFSVPARKRDQLDLWRYTMKAPAMNAAMVTWTGGCRMIHTPKGNVAAARMEAAIARAVKAVEAKVSKRLLKRYIPVFQERTVDNDLLVEGKRVLLIDDVMTTGATGASCAQALKRAGTGNVALLTVARVDRRMDSRRRAAAESEVGGRS